MNYIYDVLLNFKTVLYDFYEWEQVDEITHMRRIPIVKVSKECLGDLKYNRVKIDGSFLQKFRNKAEVFQRKSVKILEYALIFTDGREALAVHFTKGENHMKSRLLLDEEEDLLEISKNCSVENISYKIIREIYYNPFHTKKEEEMEKYIYREIEKVTSSDKLEYIYFECFDEKPGKNVDIISAICTSLKDHFDLISYKIYDVLKLASIKK